MSGADPEPLEAALRALVEPGATLTDEQRDLLVQSINSRSDVRVLGAKTVAAFERIRSYSA
jgi:hypothetical protein